MSKENHFNQIEDLARALAGIKSNADAILFIIPVYNAAEHLSNLISDLNIVFTNMENTYFVFSDDCSKDPNIERIFKESLFFKNQNTFTFRSKSNQGFVKNVNSILNVRPKQWHAVILNSDTRIFSNFIPRLLRLKNHIGNLGSITPLTNNGTIASIFNWPNGAEPSPLMNFEEITNTLSNSSAPSHIDIPTGVGFCMFMTKDALNSIGALNEEFGLGYGEECDWCRRAEKAGFRNILDLKTFVAHVGTQSFTKEQKYTEVQAGQVLLNSLHPEYNAIVQAHIKENSWQVFRLELVLKYFKRHFSLRGLIAHVLHSDPDNESAGGTEKHVRNLGVLLRENQFGCIELFPVKNNLLKINILYGEILFESLLLPISTFRSIHEEISNHITAWHVHHFLNWPENVIRLFSDSIKKPTVFSVHDFWMGCPSTNLVYKNDVFCELKKNKNDCSTCYSVYHLGKGDSLKTHQNMTSPFLKNVDAIICPSLDSEDWIKKLFTDSAIHQKIQTKNHYIDTAKNTLPPPSLFDSAKKFDVVFIGSIGHIKGFEIVKNLIPSLKERGLSTAIFGRITDASILDSPENVFPYRSQKELHELFRKHSPKIVIFASIWPETFCYTFYETIQLSPESIPVSSPLGNPSKVIIEHSLGTVAKNLSTESFMEAIDSALSRAAIYRVNISEFLEIMNKNSESYSEFYMSLINKLPSKEKKEFENTKISYIYSENYNSDLGPSHFEKRVIILLRKIRAKLESSLFGHKILIVFKKIFKKFLPKI